MANDCMSWPRWFAPLDAQHWTWSTMRAIRIIIWTSELRATYHFAIRWKWEDPIGLLQEPSWGPHWSPGFCWGGCHKISMHKTGICGGSGWSVDCPWQTKWYEDVKPVLTMHITSGISRIFVMSNWMAIDWPCFPTHTGTHCSWAHCRLTQLQLPWGKNDRGRTDCVKS